MPRSKKKGMHEQKPKTHAGCNLCSHEQSRTSENHKCDRVESVVNVVSNRFIQLECEQRQMLVFKGNKGALHQVVPGRHCGCEPVTRVVVARSTKGTAAGA